MTTYILLTTYYTVKMGRYFMPNVSYDTYIERNIKLMTHANKFSRLTIKTIYE